MTTAGTAADAQASLPLAGIRVLDFGQVWAGPVLGLYLADFGAEVIKVESAARVAVQGSATGGPDRTTAMPYNDNARNKLSVSLDPTTAAGRAILHRLVAASDIVFDNFSPRGARKLGLIYEELRAVNPRIIMASLSAAGQSGPWSDLVTYGPSLTALYGIKSLLGYAGESQPMEDVADLDPTAATYAFIAIMAALHARERTGEGQFIDMAQGEAGVAGLAEAVLEYTLNSRVMGPTGNTHRAMSPHGIYPTTGEDQWISIAVDSEGAWRALCGVLGAETLAADVRFADGYGRLRHRAAVDTAVAVETAKWDGAELTSKLQAAGVASLPVLDALGALGDSQLAMRREQVRVTAPGISPTEIVSQAAAAVATGVCDVAVVYRGLAQGQFGRFGQGAAIPVMPGAMAFTYPYGVVSPAQMYAMKVRRFMHEHGVKQEALRAISLTSYAHAQRNPRAVMYGRPLTAEDYDNSRWIVEPFHLFDCCQENDGAAAAIIVSAERAKDLKQPPAYILAAGQGNGYRQYASVHNAPDYGTSNFKTLAPRMYAMAGVGPQDVDVLQSYENFTGGVMMSVVENGFCKPDEVNEFFQPETFRFDTGTLPMNTSGGNLAECYMHGFELVTEAVRQVRGTSTAQVPKQVNISMVTSGPMVEPVSSLILGREQNR